jgi:hypothetical protein
MRIKADTADQLHRAYLFVGWTVMTLAVAASAMFALLWLDHPTRSGVWFMVLKASAIGGIVVMALGMVWLAKMLVEHQATGLLPRYSRFSSVVSEAAMWGVLAATGIAWFGTAYLLDVASQPSEQQTMTFWRTTTLTNGLSMMPPLGLLLTAFYIWSTWNIRRLKMQTYDRSERPVLFDLLSGRDPALCAGTRVAAGSFAHRLRWSFAEIASWNRLGSLLWPVAPLLAVSLLLAARNRFTTTESRAASDLLWWCSLWGLVLGADALARSADQGHVLLQALRRLKTHPIHHALSRVAMRPLPWGLNVSPLRRRALAPLIADIAKLETRLRIAPTCAVFRDLRLVGSVTEWYPATPIFASAQWATITQIVDMLVAELRKKYWSFEERAKRAMHDDDDWQISRSAEDVVAYSVAFVVRNLLARVIGGLTAALAMFTCVGLAHLLYPFQGRHFWLSVDLTCFTVAAGVTCWLLIRYERDQVLSTLWATTPGRINWTGGFIYRIAITAAIPTLLVMASFFPEVTGSLTGLIEPLQKALP